MNFSAHTTSERSRFKVVCENCGSLSIKVADPANSPDAAIVLCGRCGPWRTCMCWREAATTCSNSSATEVKMIPDQANTVSMTSLMDTARTILEAANDLGDGATVKVCRRVIDTALRGGTLAQSDINAIFEIFE
jgi:hypothetical protein